MSLLRARTLVLVGSFVGLGGCVSGAIDGETVPGGGAATSSTAGQTNGNGGTGNSAGSSSPGTSGSQTNQAGTGTKPNGGSGGSSTSGGNTGASGSGTASTGGSTSGTGNGAAGTSSTGGTSNGGAAGSNGGSNPGGGAGGGGGTPHDCKRGIAWPGKSLTNADVSSQLTWWYTWGLGITAVGAGLEFVPMVSGGGTTVANDNKAIRADAKYLLGYNEPNFFAQSNLSAAQAAADWPTLEAVAKAHNLKLVSPAVNFCGDDKTKTGPCHDTNPVHYLQDFFAACANCQVDYVAVHWYNCDGGSLKSYLDSFKVFNRPIWLTEFACAYGGDTSLAGQEKYMREAIPILEARSDVFRYSWFSGDPIPNARLLNADSSPTDLGKVYLSLPHDPTCTP